MDRWGTSSVKLLRGLQGVIAPKDVKRLLDKGVHVFWSHDLANFSKWLNTRVSKPTGDPKGNAARVCEPIPRDARSRE